MSTVTNPPGGERTTRTDEVLPSAAGVDLRPTVTSNGGDSSATTPGGVSDRRKAPRVFGKDRRRVARTPKTHLFVTICHWSMTLLLALNLLSGMRIGWGALDSPLGGRGGAWGSMLATLSPQGTLLGINLITLHVFAAFGMLLVTGVYVIYLIGSKTTARLSVTRDDLRKLWTGIRTGTFWRYKAALWCSNVLVYWTFFFFIFGVTITGIALYRLDWNLTSIFGGYSFTRALHSFLAYLFIPAVLLHSVLQWAFGRFWAVFQAQLYRPHVRAGLIAAALTVPVVFGLWYGNEQTTTLTVARITPNRVPQLDGDASDFTWKDLEGVVVRTVKGVNNPYEYVDVTVKAVHDGQHVYFMFQWDDPDYSAKRFPLRKTEQGWKVVQTAFENSDEDVFYEDKLSVYFTDVKNRGCAATCHLGVGPHAEKNQKHGVHYTQGEVGDVWHWKTVRTNIMGLPKNEPGWMDDQHFRAPEPVSDKPGARYTAGYYADPSTGGGYDYNFVKLDPSKRLADTYVRPKFLPVNFPLVTSTDATESDHDTAWWIHKAVGTPYRPENDTFPVGALIPNIVIEPFQGDRADVRAMAKWRVGKWTLESKRVLDTKSKYDVAFSFQRPVYLSVATYNRTQTRHSEHIRPIRVVLQP